MQQEQYEEEAEHNEETEGLYEHFSITADPGQKPLRIDKYLMHFRQNATRSRISNACRAGNVFVNGKAVKQNYKVKPYDSISVLLARPPRDNEIIPEDIPLHIVYEDESLIVIDKPAGMVVHPGHGNWSGTLVNALAFHFKKQGLSTDLDRIGLVHRIDKDTSGLLVVAKTEYALSFLARQFYERTSKRQYKALVWGRLDGESGTIEGHIGRHEKNRMQMAVYTDGSQGKHAVTHWKTEEHLKFFTWVSCRLETGRTHQIRAHFKHLGHPLFNDARYEGDRIIKGERLPKYKVFIENLMQILPRQALHAETLGFVHPETKEELFFTSPLPDDISAALEKIRNYIKGSLSV